MLARGGFFRELKVPDASFAACCQARRRSARQAAT